MEDLLCCPVMVSMLRTVKTFAGEFQDLFVAFDLALRNGASTSRAQFDALLAGFKSAFKEARKVRVATTPHLNVLSVFGLKSRELCHSRVVAWFLDPNQTHEQGTLFLDAFLRLVGLHPSGSDNAVVQLERPNRVDISVFSPGSFAVCIENKVYHEERPKQFADLITALDELSEAKGIPREARAAVFLTNDGRQPNSGPAEPPEGITMRSIERFEMFIEFEDSLKTAQTKSPLLISFLSAYVNGIRILE